ncbi:AfsR/SARP family transcriptional regulator [Microbacter sp. GSS18]|nr:AfsR/SARP family transcriptional regulator [Microbacter sp. GSS18]
MTMRVLGPLDTGGGSLSPRERTILEALIVRRGSAVTPDELAAACWGEAPPQTWPQQIRNAVAKIRAQLGADVIRTVGENYRLAVADSSLDSVEFETRIAEARHRDLEGAHDRAVAAYRRALDLWRGDPLADVASWPPGASEAMRLLELRKTAEEELEDCRLRAGESTAVIPDAEQLVRAEPLRERRWATLALANYRADRQAEAIAVLRSARSRLVEELGIDPSRSLVDLEAAILRQDPTLAAPTDDSSSPLVSGECPYRGLAAFGVEDRDLFFGRDSDASALAARCVRRAVVAVVGPSGSGKSSLVRAGLVPLLQDRGARVTVVTPSELGASLDRSVFDSETGVVVLDQAEELLGASRDAVDALASEADSWLQAGGCLVLTLRSDFLDRATALPRIGVAIGRGTYALSPLDEAGIRRAITGPAEDAGLKVEPGLEEVILHDAGDRPGILPALSHALVATWTHREGNTLTIAGYESSGGIAGAIAQSADQVYRDLPPEAQEACRSVMMRMVERSAEASTLRRRVALGTLTEDATRRSVVERLVAARLVTIDGDSAVIAHEAVAHTWPRLDAWLTEDEENARMLRQIEAAAAAWDSAGRPDDDLLRGGRLHAALEWRESTSPDVTATEAAFLEAAAERHAHEIRSLEQRAAHEKRRNRTLRIALAAAGVLLVTAVAATGIAVLRSAEALAAADLARLDALVATSANLRDDNVTVAALLAAEAGHRWPDDTRVHDAMTSVIAGTGLVDTIVFPHDARISGALIPGTRTALVAVGTLVDDVVTDSALHVVDLETKDLGEPLDADLPDGYWGHYLEVSPDGSTAYIQTSAGRETSDGGLDCCVNFFTIVDLVTGRKTTDTVLVDARTSAAMAVTDDGSRAYFIHSVTASPSWIERDTGTVMSLRAHEPEDFVGEPGILDGVVLVGDDLYVSADDRILVHDAESLEVTRTIPLSASGLSFALASDGAGGLLSFGGNGSVRVDLTTTEETWRQPREVVECPYPLAMTPDGFMCGSSLSVFSEHEVLTGEHTGVTFTGLPPAAFVVDALPGGDEVVIFVDQIEPAITRWRLGATDNIYILPTAELHDRLCAMAGRQLTEDEWRTYLGDEPYEPTCPESP